MRFIPLLCVLLPALTACYSGESDSLRAPVSNEGVSVTIQANLPAGLLQANVAASYFQDGRKAALVAGDIIVAKSDTDSAILRSLQNLSGDYSTVVDLSDATAGIEFAVDFDPVAARADRWYPVDELLVDPERKRAYDEDEGKEQKEYWGGQRHEHEHEFYGGEADAAVWDGCNLC